MNLHRHLVAGIGARGQKISELNSSYKRDRLVTILIEIEVADCRDNIGAFSQDAAKPNYGGFHRRFRLFSNT